jgi:hypothetical protein
MIRTKLVLILLVVILLGSGCQKTATPEQVDVLPTESPTTTPIPPSATPSPDLMPSPTPTPEYDTLTIPPGPAPEIDGTMDTDEWSAARVEHAADGSEIFFLQADGVLYIAIRGSTPEMIVGNIFIAQQDIIRIMHVSAALGTAVYEREGDAWVQTQDFDWRCRSTSKNESALAERKAFLEEEGWVSTNSRMGTPNELEYHIMLPEGPVNLALNILRSSNVNLKIPYPVDLADDVMSPTPGGLPEEMSFAPETWVLLDL